MVGFRRHAPVLGLVLAWTIALSSLLGGLSLARTLPRAHADALAAASLCLPGEDGAPAKHPAGHAPDCVFCRGPGVAHLSPALPAAPASAAEPIRQLVAIAFDPILDRSLIEVIETEEQARGPPFRI